jgi:hypothetical protein
VLMSSSKAVSVTLMALDSSGFYGQRLCQSESLVSKMQKSEEDWS